MTTSAALALALVRLTTYVDAPDLLDAGAAVAQMQRAVSGGVRYLDGGWARIVEALRSRLTRLGATIAAAAPATEVRATGDGSVRVIAGDAERRATSVVLATGGPATAARLLGSDAPTSWRMTAVEASCLDVWCGAPPPRSVTLDLDRSLYASVHAPVAQLTPSGVTLLSVLHYLPAGTRPASPDDERALLSAHAEAAGIDPVAVLGSRYLHRMTVAHGFPLADRGGDLPSVTSTGVPGVFVAGDWVGGGFLADAARRARSPPPSTPCPPPTWR